MKTIAATLTALMLLASRPEGVGQPTINSLTLTGQPATGVDSRHDYLTPSASPGAWLIFRVVAGGTGPLRFQWRFNQNDLPGQTNTTLVFTSVQLSNAGDYTIVVTNLAGATNRTMTLTVDPTFTKISTGAVVNAVGHSPGGTWGDYNNDGFLDLFVYNGMDGIDYPPFLYRNNGDGTFTDVASGPPLSVPVESYTSCWGDYDNDGQLDLFVSGTKGQVCLYRNEGNGNFTQNTNTGVILDPADWGKAVWGDYDNDGLVDFALGRFLPATHSDLYHNNGDGTFSVVSNSVIAGDAGRSAGMAWADYDNDGDADLFVGGENNSTNRFYHNNGDGSFTRVSTGSIVTVTGHWVGCDWGDYDNDGFLDLFVANSDTFTNVLYHNLGDGTFTRITNGIIVNEPPYKNTLTVFADGSLGCAWGDYDNDGWLDLYVGNEGGPGHVPIVVNWLYHNNGDGTFSKITTGSPVNEYSDSWGVTWGDYNNDGFLDLFASRGDGRGNYLYRNNGNSNHWLTVRLVGTASNRAAIGAKVRVQAMLAGVTRWQLRQISGGSSIYGHNDLWANFGLGDATNINRVRIEWPSGTVQELADVAVNQILTVTEPPRLSASATNGGIQLVLNGGLGFNYGMETSTNLLDWDSWFSLTTTNRATVFSDLASPQPPQRFYRAVAQ